MSEIDKRVLGGILGFMSFLFIMAFAGKNDVENERPNLKTCYYCCQVIDKDADIVVNKTGIRWHADCYLEYLKEEIKMAIESEKNCETCGLKDLDNNMYPCCDCLPSNNYEHWEEAYANSKETVNHPNHYRSSRFEVIDIIDEFGKDYTGGSAFDFGNVVKYILRAKKKNGVEDLKKAQWYLNRLIDKWED